MTGLDSTSTTFSGAISGNGGLIKAGSGTFTLAGSNTYGGGTTIAAGELALAGSAALPPNGSISFTGRRMPGDRLNRLLSQVQHGSRAGLCSIPTART